MTRLRSLLLVPVAALALTACGGDSDEPTDEKSSASSDVKPASGDEISTDEFSFSAPEGWTRKDDLVPTAEALAISPDGSDGFAENVNIIADPTIAKAGSVEQIAQGAEASLKTANAKEIKTGEPATIDGDEAATVTAQFTQQGTAYRTLQYAVKHADTGYVITFSFSDDVPADEQTELAESVIATWKWAS